MKKIRNYCCAEQCKLANFNICSSAEGYKKNQVKGKLHSSSSTASASISAPSRMVTATIMTNLVGSRRMALIPSNLNIFYSELNTVVAPDLNPSTFGVDITDGPDFKETKATQYGLFERCSPVDIAFISKEGSMRVRGWKPPTKAYSEGRMTTAVTRSPVGLTLGKLDMEAAGMKIEDKLDRTGRCVAKTVVFQQRAVFEFTEDSGDFIGNILIPFEMHHGYMSQFRRFFLPLVPTSMEEVKTTAHAHLSYKIRPWAIRSGAGHLRHQTDGQLKASLEKENCDADAIVNRFGPVENESDDENSHHDNKDKIVDSDSSNDDDDEMCG